MTGMRTLVVTALAASALLAPLAAGAKDFRPGDLSVCNATPAVHAAQLGDYGGALGAALLTEPAPEAAPTRVVPASG